MEREKIFSGVDIGATKIMVGLINNGGEVLNSRKFNTMPGREWQQIVDETVSQINSLLVDSGYTTDGLSGIGIGCPGTLDLKREIVYSAPNLGWENVHLKDSFESRVNVPVFLENDTNLSTMGVKYFGEGKDKQNIVGVFVGTGIGGGIILNSELLTGSTGTAGEIGHIVVDKNGPRCGCGNYGCLEAFASRASVFKNIIKELKLKAGSTTSQKDLDKIKDETLFIKTSYLNKEPITVAIVNEAARTIGIAISNVMNLINPELFVFGGSLIDSLGEYLVPIIKETALSMAMPGSKENVQFKKTILGDKAPMLGGAALVMKNLERR